MRAHLIVLSIIPVLGLPSDAPAQSQSPQLFSRVQTTLGTQTYHSADAAMEAAGVQMTIIGADDLAVVGAVVGLAASLKSLFSKTGDTDPEVVKGLTALRQQNEKIIELLSKIVGILENMDVLLKGITRDAFIFDLRAEISTAMVNTTRLAQRWRISLLYASRANPAAAKGSARTSFCRWRTRLVALRGERRNSPAKCQSGS
jgi:hypothetical protein